MEHWSIDDYKEFTNGSKKKSKYRSYKISIDGHRFDSQKAVSYTHLDVYKRQGLIPSRKAAKQDPVTALRTE